MYVLIKTVRNYILPQEQTIGQLLVRTTNAPDLNYSLTRECFSARRFFRVNFFNVKILFSLVIR